jgi:outer membrane protein assembly factor BamB
MKSRTGTAISCAFFAAFFVLSGCSSLNPFKDEPRNKPAELVEFQPQLSVRPAWSLNLSGGAPVGFAPIEASGAVIAATGDGTVVKVDAATGRLSWRADLGLKLSAGAGSDGTTTAVGTSKGEVLALDETGKIKWRANVSSEVLAPPAVGQGLVVVRSADNRIFAFESDTGKRRWLYQRPSPSLTLRSPSGIVVSEAGIYAGFAGGRLVSLAPSNGALRWEAPVANPRGATELERIADVVGTPVVAGREICAVSFQGRIACFDAANGSPVWARDASSSSGLEVDGRFAFVPDERSVVLAFAREGGSNVWKQDKLLYRGVSAPVSTGRAVALGDAKGYVHWLSRDDGSFLARSATDGKAIHAAPVDVAKGIVVQSGSGSLFAFFTE